ncbi:MAG: ABC transporter ATP-binding protein [Bacteroidetes bacterium]|nr:ABC transporter ATP-binding protein [Bacteroidota bacterium]MCL6101029.1 ABC transporter ATP-binding protein [Bacteroidota bacterium]
MSVIVEDISKIYGNQLALDKISFSVDSGTILGILGPNGAGKSTLLKIITGYLRPSSGWVKINQVEVDPDKLDIKRMIGYLPENNPLYSDLYVKEYLGLVAGLYKIPNRKKRSDETIELTGLGSEMHKKIGALSKGYRQRVGLAQALLHDPALLILDEPTSGLDPAQLVEIRQLIRNISSNKTVLLSTHIMQEVEAICDRVLILNQGKVVALETPENIKKLSLNKIRKIAIEFSEPATVKIFESIAGVIKIEQTADNKFLIYGPDEDIRPALYRLAVKNNLTLLTLHEQESSMEKSFLELIK